MSWSKLPPVATIINYFLLKEDGFYLLQESGDKLILSESPIPNLWSNVLTSTGISWGKYTLGSLTWAKTI